MALSAGARLGPYEVLSVLGAGGMGEVYEAVDSRLGRKVALKILPADVAADPDRRDRFEREARAAAALNHPHIVTIHSVEAIDGLRVLTMELVAGQTLADVLSRVGCRSSDCSRSRFHWRMPSAPRTRRALRIAISSPPMSW